MSRFRQLIQAPLRHPVPAEDVDNMNAGHSAVLRRTLPSEQIFFIVVGGVIGAGFFSGSSLILGIAGPGGALLAFTLVGLVAICVMEGIAEMILIWPIPNAMVQFVKVFVDRELGIVIGIGYWYTFSVTFSALIIAAVNLAEYWNISAMWKSICFFIIPVGLGIINTQRVEVFATLEFFGGIIKLLLVAAVVLILICLNLGAGGRKPIHSKFLDDGLQYNSEVASGRWAAVCNAIPLAIFAYLGIELVTMTAFEARSPIKQNLAWPAKNIAWVISVIYILTTFTFVLDVWWENGDLPQFYNQGISGLVGGATNPCLGLNATAAEQSPKYAAPILAVNEANFSGGVLVAFFIYSTLSAANTGLYVASRAVYGLARDIRIQDGSPWWVRMVAAPSLVEPRTKSPWWAVVISVLFLYWLPFIHLYDGYSMEELQQTLINMGSVSCLLVWSSQCLAYICFHYWRNLHEPSLKGDFYKQFRPSIDNSNLAYFQPALAWFGLVATLLIVVVFNSASMWNGKCLGVKFASAFISPILLLLLWLFLKYMKHREAVNGKLHSWSVAVCSRGAWSSTARNIRTWENTAENGRGWRAWIGAIFRWPSWVGVDLSKWKDFKAKLHELHNLIRPDEIPAGPDEDLHESPGGFVMANVGRTGAFAYSTSNQPRHPHAGDYDDVDQGPPGDIVMSRRNRPNDSTRTLIDTSEQLMSTNAEDDGHESGSETRGVQHEPVPRLTFTRVGTETAVEL